MADNQQQRFPDKCILGREDDFEDCPECGGKSYYSEGAWWECHECYLEWKGKHPEFIKGERAATERIVAYLRRPAAHNEDDSTRRREADHIERIGIEGEVAP